MATAYHVTVGGVIVKVQFVDVQLGVLGIPESGVDITVNRYDGEIKTDVAGPKVAAELQEFGGDAKIKMRLTSWDDALVQRLQTFAGATPDYQGFKGVLPPIGALIGTNQLHVRLLVDSATDLPWNFPTARLRPFMTKPSSERNFLDLEFYAWAFIPSTAITAAGAVLWNRVRT